MQMSQDPPPSVQDLLVLPLLPLLPPEELHVLPVQDLPLLPQEELPVLPVQYLPLLPPEELPVLPVQDQHHAEDFQQQAVPQANGSNRELFAAHAQFPSPFCDIKITEVNVKEAINSANSYNFLVNMLSFGNSYIKSGPINGDNKIIWRVMSETDENTRESIHFTFEKIIFNVI